MNGGNDTVKSKSNEKKSNQLGMPYGTANARLRKNILFSILKKNNENYCFRCKEEIKDEKTLSIEHKIPWLDNDISLFWDLDNIAFSHLSCNSGDARSFNKDKLIHPSSSAYKKGCRCDECRSIENKRRKSQRARGINT